HRQLATGDSGYVLSTSVDPPRVRVAIDAVSADDRFANGLDTTLEVSGLAGAARKLTVTLEQTAAGRYEGEFPLDQYGSFQLRAIHRAVPGGPIVSETPGTLSVPYARE